MLRCAYWIAALFITALVMAKFSQQTGFTSLIRFGTAWQESRLSRLQGLPIANSSGYDGQFYAQIALDPLLLDPGLKQAIDAPAYRARRILCPAIASILGLGNPWRTLQVYALLNVFCWFALAWLLQRSIGTDGWISFGRWFGCMFSLGVLDSVRQSLVDLPALLLLFLAVDSQARAPSPRRTMWLALGNLAKETSLLGSLALSLDPVETKNHWRRILLSLACASLPLGLWMCYVQQRFGGASAIAGSGNFTWPLLGLLTQARISLGQVWHGELDGRHSFGLLAMVGFSVQSWVLWRAPRLQSAWWRIGAAYSLLLLVLSLWVWSGYWAACRAVLPLTLAFNLLLPASRRFWLLWALGNITLLHGVWRFL